MTKQTGHIVRWCLHHSLTHLTQYLLFLIELLETKVFPNNYADQRDSFHHSGLNMPPPC